MSVTAIVELVLAAVIIVVGVLQYRKRAHDGSRTGSQSAVILFVIAAIMIIHALYGFER